MDIIAAITEVADALEKWYYTGTSVKYIPTTQELPGTLGFLQSAYREHGGRALPVWSGGTDTSIYARIGKPEANLIFRLHHDLMHVQKEMGMDVYGELTVAWAGLTDLHAWVGGLSPEAQLIYTIDTAGQTLLYYLTGEHLEDQYAFVSWAYHFMTHTGDTTVEYTLQDLQDAVRLYQRARKPAHVNGGC